MTRRGLTQGVRVIGWLVGTAMAVGWALWLRPQWLGGPLDYVVIRGDSMLPSMASNDLVFLTRADTYRVGDVVGYRVPIDDIGAGHLVIHRIVEVDEDGFRLQGDNNPGIDPWEPAVTDIAGRAIVILPGAGRWLATLRQPLPIAALAAALVTMFMTSRWLPSTNGRPGSDRRRPLVPPRTVPADP